jgi:hypothetical protein
VTNSVLLRAHVDMAIAVQMELRELYHHRGHTSYRAKVPPEEDITVA